MSKQILLRTACAGVLLLLAGCGGSHMVRVNGVERMTGSQPAGPGMGFSAVCSIPASPHDFQNELNAVAAAPNKLGTKLYVYVPNFRTSSAGCTDALHEAQGMAIQRAGLFDKVIFANNAPRDSHPIVGDADYYMWSEGDELVVAYKEGPRISVSSGPGRLEEWVKGVASPFNSARDWAESHSNIMMAHLVGPHTYYVINGREFSDPAAAKEYLAGRRSALVEDLHPAEQVAASARIYLTPADVELDSLRKFEQSQHILSGVIGPNAFTTISTRLNGPNDRNTGMEASDVQVAYIQALSEAKVSAVRRSGLFAAVNVIQENTSSPPYAGPNEVVVWQYRGSPQWSVRVGLGPVHTAAWPAYDKNSSDTGADGWIANLRAAVAAAQADPQPEGVASLMPGCNLPQFTDTVRKALGGKGGSTTLSLDIAADGHVAEAKIAASSGHKEMDNAVVQSFAKCSFKPPVKRAGFNSVIVSYGFAADAPQQMNINVGGTTIRSAPANQ